MSTTVSRRNLVKGAAIGAAALGAAAMTTSSAMADEPADSYTYADTIAWDAEYDVVVLGMGFSGMISAMEAADAGATVLLCDKMSEGESGGNSRVCGQLFAYGYDDPDNALTYYTALAAGRDVPEDMLKVMADGIAGMATTMSEKFGMDTDEFMDWTDAAGGMGAMSPEYPEMPGSDKIGLWSTHAGVSDSYLFQSMRSRLADNYDDKIDIWFESPALSLFQDPVSKAVIGVNISRLGASRNVHALNGVCVCTGGYEDDKEMIQNYLGVINYAPIGGLYNTGDGIKMCQKVGAKLWHMSAYEGGFGLCGLGYDTPEGVNAIQISGDNLTTGATIVVGTWGKRYQNEAAFVRHGHMTDGNGIWENPEYPEKSFVIWDKTQYDAIVESGGLNSDYADTVVECATVADAAAAIGCEEANLQETFDDFNFFAENGKDYDWGRAADSMRAFDGEAYYVMPVKNLVLNTQGGPQNNTDAQIIDLENQPIPHLYSAGEMGAITACMYQGGTNVAGCFIMGQIAGASAATPKDPLPAYTADPKVESNPEHLGEETDHINS